MLFELGMTGDWPVDGAMTLEREVPIASHMPLRLYTEKRKRRVSGVKRAAGEGKRARVEEKDSKV